MVWEIPYIFNRNSLHDICNYLPFKIHYVTIESPISKELIRTIIGHENK